MRLKLELLQLVAVIAAIALSNAVPLNRFDSDGNNLRLDRRNISFDSEFGSVCVIDDVLYQIGDNVPPTSSCERCICEPPTISCSPLPCDFKPNCKAIKMSDQCCTVYQCECEHNGRVYQNGERLENPEDPCNVCYCRGGEVSCTTIECYKRGDCEPRYVQGRCCPKYDHCPPLEQNRLEKTRPQFVRTDFNRDTTASIDPTSQQRNSLFDLDNEASEDVTARAVTTSILEDQTRLTTLKLQTTEPSLSFLSDSDISVKHHIADEVQLTADSSHSVLSESRKVPSDPQLIPATNKPIVDIPSTTSFYSSEEGSGTTDGSASSSTEGIDGSASSSTEGVDSKMEVDIFSGDGEGSGAIQPELQTEGIFQTTHIDYSPEVHIVTKSVASNEVVTNPTTLDYTKKPLSESTNLAEEFTTVTETSRTSPIDDIRTESFIVNDKPDTATTNKEIETVTEKALEDSTKATGGDATESNELDDDGKTTASFIRLKASSVELESKSEESEEKGSDDSESRSALVSDQIMSETKTESSVDVTNPSDVTTTQATTFPENVETVTAGISQEVKSIKIISSISAVKVYNAEAESTTENTPQEEATETFTNLENEFPVLPMGSVLINGPMDVVLATTEEAAVSQSEENSSLPPVDVNTDKGSSTEGVTGVHLGESDLSQRIMLEIDATTQQTLDLTEGVTGAQESLAHLGEAVAAGSDLSQRMTLETDATTQQTLDLTEGRTVAEEEDHQTLSDITTVVPTLRKSAALLVSQSAEEEAAVVQSTDSTQGTLPTTTEVTLLDEPSVNKELGKSSASEDISEKLLNSDDDLTTLSSDLVEITAVTQTSILKEAEISTGTKVSEESTTEMPEMTEYVAKVEIAHSEVHESSSTDAPPTALTEVPKMARTVQEEDSTLSEGTASAETTTQQSLPETTIDNREAFVRLASDTSNINAEIVNLESSETTKSGVEDTTEQTERALLRAALSEDLEHRTEDAAPEETTTSSSTDQELSNTNNDNVRTEIYPQVVTGAEEVVTEQNKAEQNSELKVKSLSEDILQNDSPDSVPDVLSAEENTTPVGSVEESTQTPEEISHLASGSVNLRERAAIKLLAEPSATEQPATEQATYEELESRESSTIVNEYTTELASSEELSTIVPSESSTLIPKQSEEKESFSGSELSKSVTEPQESATALPTSPQVDTTESATVLPTSPQVNTTEHSGEETTPKSEHTTLSPASGTVNIKREISAAISHQLEEGTEIPTTSSVLSDASLVQQRAAEVSNTEEFQSSEDFTTESTYLSLNSSDVNGKLELESMEQGETSTLIPEQVTAEDSSISGESTEEVAESSTSLYIADATDIPQEYEDKQELIARLVQEMALSRGNNIKTDTEIESTTLPRDWLKSDNASDVTENSGLTTETEISSESKETATFIPLISTVTDIPESPVTEDTAAATTVTAVEEEKSVENKSNSTDSPNAAQNDDDVKEDKHTVEARSVDDFDIKAGNENSFVRPEESLTSDEYHSNFNGHTSSFVRDSEDFSILDNFYTRLLHRQAVN